MQNTTCGEGRAADTGVAEDETVIAREPSARLRCVSPAGRARDGGLIGRGIREAALLYVLEHVEG